MLLNADFAQPVIVIPKESDWLASPAAGVSRLMLDRIGTEVARATSIVRYAAGSQFARHEHAKGEEFLVLDGVFSDENGDYPTGTYVRNPPGSGHAPFSKGGCRILVKLRQFDPQDLVPAVINTHDEKNWATDEATGIDRVKLHSYAGEDVQMLRVPPGGVYATKVASGGLELLVVNGSIEYAGEQLGKESWLRVPAGADLHLAATCTATLWLKTGHLPPG